MLRVVSLSLRWCQQNISGREEGKPFFFTYLYLYPQAINLLGEADIIPFNTVNMTQTNAQTSGTEPAIIEKTSVPAKSKPDVDGKATPSTDASLPYYKIVKVRKPDGTIVKVKRPITAEGTGKKKNIQTTHHISVLIRIQKPPRSRLLRRSQSLLQQKLRMRKPRPKLPLPHFPIRR
jgi:hypothetical protein